MNGQSPSTAVVIPTIGGFERLARCLTAIQSQDLPFSRVIVVVDGACRLDMDPQSIADGVEWVTNRRRQGFAGAANTGIRRALEDSDLTAVALVNDDLRLSRGWHRAADSVLRTSADVGACATVVVQVCDPRKLDSAGIEWCTGAFADNRGHGAPPPAVDAPPEEVWGASAAAALYRRTLFDRVGLFDESFFAYQEDVELALRARLSGMRCMVAPAARAEHDGFGSNRPFPVGGTWADFFNARNRVTLLVTTLPASIWRTTWRSIASRHLRSVIQAKSEGRAPAVWLGFTHALCRLPSSLIRRRRRMRAVTLSLTNRE